MTNDFVALLKDSSLVSVLTVLELTKQTQIFATNLGSWVIPGTLCAALYLAMSLPLSALARRLERRWRAPTHDDVVLHVDRSPPAARARVRSSTGVSLEVRPRRARRDHGPVRLRQDDDPPRHRRPRTVRGRDGLRSTASTLAGGADIAGGDAARAAPQGRHGVPVSLPVRASVGASTTSASRRCTRTASPRRTRGGAAHELLAGVRRRAPRRRRCRASCRAARRSASRSRARWRSIRRCC